MIWEQSKLINRINYLVNEKVLVKINTVLDLSISLMFNNYKYNLRL